MQETLDTLSGILVLAATIVYVWGIIRRDIDPAKAMWIVWTVLSILTALGMFVEDAINYQIIVIAFADIVILNLAFVYGSTWSWTKIDVICLVSAAMAILLWWATDNALWAIILLLAATVIGFVPMVALLWQRPDAEKPYAWVIMCVSTVLLMLSLGEWTIATAAQPIVYLAIPVITLLLLSPRRPALA
jgi:hypothetical protein